MITRCVLPEGHCRSLQDERDRWKAECLKNGDQLLEAVSARAESSAQWLKWQEAHDRLKREHDQVVRERDEARTLLAVMTKQYEELLDKPSVAIPLNKIRIADLLVCALEGGSNYWYTIEEFIKPTGKIEHVYGEGEVFRHIDYPLNEGGAIVVSDRKQCVGTGLDREVMTKVHVDWVRIQQGLKIMSEKYPQHYANWLSEQDDAETGDVFLQCCVFGELVYG